MSLFLALLLLVLVYHLYIRYVPVCCIPTLTLQQLRNMNDEKVAIVDLRDYNDSSPLLVKNTIRVPLAYLKRNYQQLHYEEVIIIASDCITKNMGIRTLKRYGFKVRGAYIEGAGKCYKDSVIIRA
ncbi:MAG TPA: sulfurtransferase [Anoxybacillus sp.]|nr:sulfurtransferase [Anoxybacillus sp.]